MAIADNVTYEAFLKNYCKGYYSFNTQTLTFNILYDAATTIIDYGFFATSTWVVLDQSGKVIRRWNNDTRPEVIDEVKATIDSLLE